VLEEAGELIGRQAEVAALERSRDGRARIAEICGDPGIGKTRLRQLQASRGIQLARAESVALGVKDASG
jgi:hypothetical protein